MHFYIHALLSVLLLQNALAQSVADLPTCSLSCFQTAIGLTPCAVSDYVCQCQADNLATIKQSVTGCLAKSTCSLSDLQQVQTWSNTFCPNVLSSTAGSTATSAPSTAPSASSTVSTATPAPASAMASSTGSSRAISKFGAGTPGTNWGELPDTDSKANRGPALEAVSIVLLCIAAIVLAFRFFARTYTKRSRQAVKGVWLDEYFAVLALVFTTGVTADIIVGTQYGMGTHMAANTTAAQLVSIVKIVYAFVIIITACFSVLKFSILTLYLRMTPAHSHKITIYVLIGLVVCHGTAAVLAEIWQCNPVSQFWSLSYPIFQNPHCVDILPFDIFNSAWSVLEDVVIWTLPVPTVYSLNLPFHRKAVLYALLGVSLISVTCSILRLAFTILWVRSSDISWNYPLIPFFSNMEACVALITTSVPAILPLLRPTRSKKPRAPPQPPPQIDIEQAPSSQAEDSETGEKEWESQNSTAVPSTAGQTQKKEGKTWSLLSRLHPNMIPVRGRKLGVFGDPNEKVSTYKSASGVSSGPRTELKEFEGEDDGVLPGLKTKPTLKMK